MNVYCVSQFSQRSQKKCVCVCWRGGQGVWGVLGERKNYRYGHFPLSTLKFTMCPQSPSRSLKPFKRHMDLSPGVINPCATRLVYVYFRCFPTINTVTMAATEEMIKALSHSYPPSPVLASDLPLHLAVSCHNNPIYAVICKSRLCLEKDDANKWERMTSQPPVYH